MLCGVDGFVFNSKVYSGQENERRFRKANEPDLGSCSNVVVRMTRHVSPGKNHRVYFDNYFSSVPLVYYL